MLNKQQLFLVLGLASALVTQPAWAESQETGNREQELEGFAQASPAQVTGIQLNPTPEGLEILLETTGGASTLVQTTQTEQGLVAEITNAQLNLPGMDTFRQENPTPDIATVTVTPLDENRIRVLVTGTAGVPTGQVFVRGKQGLIVNVTPVAEPTAETLPTEPEPTASDLEPIELIVTATRTAEEEEDIPRSVTVITREEIETQTAITRDLVDIIGKTVPGLGPPTQSDSNFGQSIRGRSPQVLIDGVPITSNDSNDSFSRDLRSITPEAVERIEIVRGPSAVFGNGATGGVINIITRQPSEQRLTSQTEVGCLTDKSVGS